MTGKGKAALTTAAAAVTMGLAAVNTPAATWDGGTAGTGTSWSTASNWVGDLNPTSGENISFNGTDYIGGGGSTWTNGSNVVTLQNGNSAIQLGQVVTSQTTGIPNGTTVTGIASDSRTLTLSASSTQSGAGNITVLGVGGLVGGPTVTLDANRTIDTLNFNHSTAFALGSTTENAGGRFTLTLTNVTRSTGTGATINANVNLVAGLTGRSIWRDTGSGATTVTSSVSSTGSVVLNKGGSSGGTVILNGNNTFTGSVVVDTGTLTFGGTNAYTGSSTASGGTLNLNFNSGFAPNSDIINSASALILGGVRGGGTLSVTGKTSVSASQTFASTAVAAGASGFSISNGTSVPTRTVVNLGAITRTAGGTVNFAQPSGTGNTAISATNGYTTATANDASGILGAWVTVAGIDWATNNGTNIVAYTGYSTVTGAGPALTTGTTSNLLLNNASTGDVSLDASAVTINTLRVSDAALRTLTIGTGNTLRLNGILSTGTNGIVLGASGNAGTLTAGLADDTAGELILNNSTGATINAVIANNGSGAVTLTKAGAGTAILTAANTYTGGTYVTGGTLSLASGASVTSGGNIMLTGGTLNLGGNTQTLSGELAVAGGTVSNGTLDKTGGTIAALSGTLSTKVQGSTALLKTSSGAFTFGNATANTYTGDTVIEEGSVSNTNNVITVAGNLIVGTANGGTAASFTASGNNVNWNAAKNLTVYRNSSVNLGGGSHTYGGTVTVLGTFTNSQLFGLGTWNIQGGTINGTFFGNARTINHTGDVTSTLNAGGGTVSLTLNVADGTPEVDLIFNGGTTGAVNMTKSGAGLSLWTASQNYTGVTSINNGTLRVTNLRNGTVNSNIGASSVAASNLVFGGGTLQYTGAGSTTDRLFTINTSTAGTIDASGTGALVFNGVGSVAYGTTNQARTLTLTGTSTADNTMGVNIGNNGTTGVVVNKTGAGRWILSGTNVYTGATSVTAGTLLVASGASLGTSNVQVNGATAVFGGEGTVGGNVTVSSGKLSPGKDGIGTLTLNGNVTINDTLEIELDANGLGSADKIIATGAGKVLNITNAKVNFTSIGGSLDDEAYIFASYTSLSGTFAPENITGLSFGQVIDYNYLGNNQLAVVPEPATAGWLLLGAGAGLMRRRRRSGTR